MKCPLCSDGVDRKLEEMDKHLADAHDMNQSDREQFGGDFSHLVDAQLALEHPEKYGKPNA